MSGTASTSIYSGETGSRFSQPRRTLPAQPSGFPESTCQYPPSDHKGQLAKSVGDEPGAGRQYPAHDPLDKRPARRSLTNFCIASKRPFRLLNRYPTHRQLGITVRCGSNVILNHPVPREYCLPVSPTCLSLNMTGIPESGHGRQVAPAPPPARKASNSFQFSRGDPTVKWHICEMPSLYNTEHRTRFFTRSAPIERGDVWPDDFEFRIPCLASSGDEARVLKLDRGFSRWRTRRR